MPSTEKDSPAGGSAATAQSGQTLKRSERLREDSPEEKNISFRTFDKAKTSEAEPFGKRSKRERITNEAASLVERNSGNLADLKRGRLLLATGKAKPLS